MLGKKILYGPHRTEEMEKFMRLSSNMLERRLRDTGVLTALWAKGIISMDELETVKDLSTTENRRKLINILQAG